MSYYNNEELIELENKVTKLQQENAELRDGLMLIKQMVFSMKANSQTFSNENVEEVSREGSAAMLLIEKLLRKND